MQRKLVIPYLVFFSVAAVVSVFPIGPKTLLFVSSSRSPHAKLQHGPVKLDGAEFPAELAKLEAVTQLKENSTRIISSAVGCTASSFSGFARVCAFRASR